MNPNYVDINAAEQMEDSDSVYSFYKRLIELRHSQPVVSAGSWNLVDADDECVYAFIRQVEQTCDNAKADVADEAGLEHGVSFKRGCLRFALCFCKEVARNGKYDGFICSNTCSKCRIVA
mgnify:CR=1 FL=1